MKLCWFYIGEQLTKDIQRHWRKNKINMKSRLNASCLCKFSKPGATDMCGPMCFYLLHSLFTTKVCLVRWQGIQYTSEKRYHWCAGNCIGCKSSCWFKSPMHCVSISLESLASFWWIRAGVMHQTNESIKGRCIFCAVWFVSHCLLICPQCQCWLEVAAFAKRSFCPSWGLAE